MTMKKKSEQLNWLKSEIDKDDKQLLKEKDDFIKNIKKIKKDDIVKEQPKQKLTIWQRIIKVLIN
jgi:hypothetical protein